MSHGGGGDERWLVSYADFITLLMVLFVVLYSMSQIDVERYKELAEGLSVAFGGGGPVNVVDPSINQAGIGTGESAPSPITISGIPSRSPDTLDIAGQMGSLLAANQLAGAVSIRNNIEGVLIALSEQLLFVPGTAELIPDAYPVLTSVAEMLRPLPNEIWVIGHTDDQPPTDPRYRDNWELSAARAVNIVNYLIAQGIEADRLMASGKGDVEPVFPNDTPEHRAFNSRAEIVVIYSLEQEVFDLNIFPTTESEPTGLYEDTGASQGE
ncbi:MAG: OmpA family protein [Anaerolineales bacterium]|nr:OmpA family protein [Anaerolineales bacterium]